MASKEYKLGYNPAFDGLRGIAILLVIFSHAHVPLFGGAFLGVDLFFVLSGFLITSLMLIERFSTGGFAYWRFYRRRLLRLMPALALFLGAYVWIAPLVWPDLDDVRQDAWVSLLYLADYGIAFFDSPGTLLHVWSLSVEEHFYLIWPPVLMLLVRFSPRGGLWRPMALLYVASWLWRLLWVVQGQAFYEIFFRFDTRVSGLIAGSLLAALVMEKPAAVVWLQERLHHALWIPLSIPILMGLDWDNQGAMVWGIPLVEFSAMVLLVAMQQRAGVVYDMLRAPLLVRLGTLSYGIYLWHYPVVRYFRAEYPWPVALGLTLVVATALAALSFYTVERWAMRLRDRKPALARSGATGAGQTPLRLASALR